MPDVVVVGAGLSGLACARRLRALGLDARVVEARPRPGGVVWSDRVDGCLVEAGPNTILPTSETMAIISDAGIADRMVTAPPGAPRFVYVGGRLRRVPWALSPAGTLRALAEPLVRRRQDPSDESLAAFFTRRFGPETHERLAAPFVTGIYAGDTSELGVQGVFPRLVELERAHGSVILGMLLGRRRGGFRHRLASFRDGMGTLATGLAAELDVRYGASVESLTPGWRARIDGESIRVAAIVVATPAYAASRLLRAVDPHLAGLLESVCYAPIVVASVSVADRDFPRPLAGFGFLAPRSEGLNVLGTLFNSCLFPGRAPEGETLLTSFLGGRLSPGVVDWPEDRIWRAVDADLRRVLKLAPGSPGRPIRLLRYPQAIPQYRIGHPEWRSRLETRLREQPGLFLTGNYLDGVSLPAAMEHGARTADRVIRYLRRS